MKQIQEEEDGDVRDGEKPLRGQLNPKLNFEKKKPIFPVLSTRLMAAARHNTMEPGWKLALWARLLVIIPPQPIGMQTN